MDILTNEKLIIINRLGVFLFILKALGFYVGINYFWIIVLMAWQPAILIGLVLVISAVLAATFITSIAMAGYHKFKKKW